MAAPTGLAQTIRRMHGMTRDENNSREKITTMEVR